MRKKFDSLWKFLFFKPFEKKYINSLTNGMQLGSVYSITHIIVLSLYDFQVVKPLDVAPLETLEERGGCRPFTFKKLSFEGFIIF